MRRTRGFVPFLPSVLAAALSTQLSLSLADAETLVPAGPQEPTGAEGPLSFAETVAFALSANKALAAARLRRDIGLAEVDVARQRPNPDLALESERETPREALTLSLPVETAGKRGRRVELAKAGVRSGETEIAQLAVEVRDAVRRAYYALAAAQKRLSESEELLGLARRASGAARDRFETGAAPRLEVLQSELAEAQTENEVDAARAALISARGDLNALLARPPAAPISAAGDLADGTVPDAEAATDLAMAASSELRVLDGRIDEARARANLAQARRFPDPVVTVGLTHRSPPEFTTGWRASVAVTLPVFTTRRAEVMVEERTVAQLRAERDAAAFRIRGEVVAAAALASARRQQVLRYRDRAVPGAAEVEAMAEESYRSGQTGLVVLLQALQAARDIRLRAIDAGYDYQLALAEVERAIGAPLP